MKERLKEIATIGAGQGAPQGDHNYCDNGTPFVKAGNLQELLEGADINDIQQVSEEVAKKHRLKKYPQGTILFAKSGMSCMKGYVYVLPQEAHVVSHLACITPTEDMSEYLRYYFTFHKPNKLVKDAAYPSISLSDIGELEVDTKTEQERSRIVEQLRNIETIISLRQKEINEMDELIKARFVELFGDIVLNPIGFKESTVAEYCQMTQGTQIPMSEQISEYKEGYYRYLYIRDLKYEDENWIYVLNQYDEKKLTEDDLVVVNTGNTAGEIYRGKDGILSNNLFKVSFDTEILSTTYLYYYFGSDAFQKMLWSEMKEGTQPHLGHKIFGSKKLLVPPMAIQEQFSNFVKQVDKSKVVGAI